MDDHLNRPKTSNKNNPTSPAHSDFVKGGKAASEASAGLSENFLQQLTGAAGRGTAKPVRREKPKVLPASQGPIAAGDVMTRSSQEAISAPDYPIPSFASFSMTGLPAASEGQVSSAFAEFKAGGASNVGEPEGPESTEKMSRYRRVVYPPTSHTTQEIETPTLSRTASYPSIPSLQSIDTTPKPAPVPKKTAFESITQLDIDRSSTELDAIAPYIKQAHYKTTGSGEHTVSQGRARSHNLTRDSRRYESARSIHFDAPAPPSSDALSRSPQYSPLRSALDFASGSSLPMAAASGGYSHAPATHFMYRPRIPSLRYVRIEDPSYMRVLAFTEHLEALAPWFVGAIFTMAGILALVILLSL